MHIRRLCRVLSPHRLCTLTRAPRCAVPLHLLLVCALTTTVRAVPPSSLSSSPSSVKRKDPLMSSAASALTPLPDVSVHSSRVSSVLGQNPGPMTLQGTNTYLIGTGTSRILLDTAQGVPDYLKNLKSHMQQQGVTSLSAILLSHWHHDHTGGLADVRGLLAPGGAVYKGLGSKLLPAGVLTANPGLAESIVPIVDGQVFRTEGATLTALHTPGHTEDHHCFLLEEEQAVFSGDTILGAGTAVFQDLHAYMHSLRRIHRANPRRIYPAHGPLIDGDNDESAPRRIEQYIAHREQREAQIVELLRSQRKADSQDAAAASGDDSEALTTQQIVEKIYVGIPSSLILAATSNVLLHLDKLVKEKRVLGLPAPTNDADTTSSSCNHAHSSATDSAASAAAAASSTIGAHDKDDCAAEVKDALASAVQRASWRWKLL